MNMTKITIIWLNRRIRIHPGHVGDPRKKEITVENLTRCEENSDPETGEHLDLTRLKYIYEIQCYEKGIIKCRKTRK